MKIKLPLVVLSIFLLTACNTGPHYRVHHTFVDSPKAKAPKKVLLIPADIVVNELTYGGVSEEVKDWSKEASANVEKALQNYFGGNNDKHIQLVALPKLSRKEADIILQHLSLYRQVAAAAFDHAYGEGPDFWKHKVSHFDYTLGNGLAFLKRKSGADSAIIVYGKDHESSGGRKTAQVAGAILPFVQGPSKGSFYMTTGIVELNSGNLLWFNSVYQADSMRNFRNLNDAMKTVSETFREYPGVAKYRRAAK